MSIIPQIPEDVLDAARACVSSSTGFDKKLLERAQKTAELADQIVQRVGVVLSKTQKDLKEGLMMGVTFFHFDQDALGPLVQASHTTAGFEQGHFYRGLLFDQCLIGYNNDWSRFEITMEMMDASGPLRVTEFWGAMRVELPSGKGPAMPAKPLIGLIKNTTGNSASERIRLGRDDVQVQWGFRLSTDHRHPGYFVPVTPIISQN
jgi:hypothetical protein